MEVNWKALRAALPRSGCFLETHPTCQRHVTEYSAYQYAIGQIKYFKQTLEVLQGFKAALKRSTDQCEKHWIPGCYECSPLPRLAKLEKDAKRGLNGARWLLFQIPTVCRYLGRPLPKEAAEQARLLRAVKQAETERIDVRPIEHMFTERPWDGTSMLKASDIEDNIRLIDSWLKGQE